MTSRISLEVSSQRSDEGAPSSSLVAKDLWFSLFWPVSVLFHLAGNGGHLLPLDGIGVLQIGMAAVAVAAIVHPKPWLTAALAAVYLAVLAWKLPVVGNHEIFLGLVAMTVVIAVPLAARHGGWWVHVAAPAVRLVLIIGYGCIAFSKLNTGFFDLAVSCAVIFGDDLLGPFGPGVDHPHGVPAWPVVGFTAGVELAIPVLLAVRRTRSVGVIVALGFHFLLALDPASHIWDFSATLLPMFVLFGSAALRSTLDRIVTRLSQVPKRELLLALVTVAAVHGVVLIINSRVDADSVVRPWFGPWLVAYPLWLAAGGGVLVLAVLTRATRRDLSVGAAIPTDYPHGWRPAAPLLIVVVIAVLNGLGPYLEYRSAAAFNMYANLEISDGQSNHFLIGGFGATDAEPSMVEIHAASPNSSLAYYVQNQLLLPAENLDRYLRDHPDEDPSVSRGGEPVMSARSLGFGADRPDGFVAEIGDLLQYKLGFRRAVDATGAHSCQRVWGPLG